MIMENARKKMKGLNIIVRGRRMKCTRDKVMDTGFGEHTSISTQILLEESRRAFYTTNNHAKLYMMMIWENRRMIWMIPIVKGRFEYGKPTREGDYILLLTQIHMEDSKKIFYTNIVCCFAGTVIRAGFYVLVKPIQVVSASSMLIFNRCNHCIVQLKKRRSKQSRQPHTNMPNWAIMYQFWYEGEKNTKMHDCLNILCFLENLQTGDNKVHERTLIVGAHRRLTLPRSVYLGHGIWTHFTGCLSIIWRSTRVYSTSPIFYKHELVIQSHKNNRVAWR